MTGMSLCECITLELYSLELENGVRYHDSGFTYNRVKSALQHDTISKF